MFLHSYHLFLVLFGTMWNLKVYSKLIEGYKTFRTRVPCLARIAYGGRVQLYRPGVGSSSLCYGPEASTHDHCTTASTRTLYNVYMVVMVVDCLGLARML